MKAKYSNTSIASLLGVSVKTVIREVQRGTIEKRDSEFAIIANTARITRMSDTKRAYHTGGARLHTAGMISFLRSSAINCTRSGHRMR